MGFITDMKAARALGRGDYRRVIQLHKAEIEASGDESLALWKIAFSYMRLKEYEMAIEWGTRGLALNPEDHMILNLLMGCYHERGDHDRAYQCVCHALDMPPLGPVELPAYAWWFIRLLSLLPGMRRLDPDRLKHILKKPGKQDDAWRRRAEKYKKWYEATHGGIRR